jgi:prevent-host-death family protein
MGSVLQNLYEAKTNLSKLVDRAAAGEEIIIMKNGKPMARLVPFGAPKRRKSGGAEGKYWISEDFDAPLPDDILDAFEGRGD